MQYYLPTNTFYWTEVVGDGPLRDYVCTEERYLIRLTENPLAWIISAETAKQARELFINRLKKGYTVFINASDENDICLFDSDGDFVERYAGLELVDITTLLETWNVDKSLIDNDYALSANVKTISYTQGISLLQQALNSQR